MRAAETRRATAIARWVMNESDDYRLTAQRLRTQATGQLDRTISEQLEKIAQRYDELAEQIDATIRRSD